MVETLEGLSSVNFPKHKDLVCPQDQIEQMLTNAITQAGERSWFFKKAMTFMVTKSLVNITGHEMNKPSDKYLSNPRKVSLWLGFLQKTQWCLQIVMPRLMLFKWFTYHHIQRKAVFDIVVKGGFWYFTWWRASSIYEQRAKIIAGCWKLVSPKVQGKDTKKLNEGKCYCLWYKCIDLPLQKGYLSTVHPVERRKYWTYCMLWMPKE